MEIAELHKKTDRLGEQMLEQFARLESASFEAMTGTGNK